MLKIDYDKLRKELDSLHNKSKDEVETRQLVSTQDEVDIDDTDEIEKNQKHWATSSDRTMFWGTSDVTNSIPPGFFKINVSDQIGIYFRKLIVVTDDLITLPEKSQDIVLNDIRTFWERANEYKKRGFVHKRGIMMYGEPGTGKTCIIQMLIKELITKNGLIIFADDPSLLAQGLQMLKRIEGERPIIVVMEDFDALVENKQSENAWLSLLDGEIQIDNVVYLATTNYIDNIDKRFTDRPSRFDSIIPVPPPTALSRAIYLLVKEPSLSFDEVRYWTSKTAGFSYAHLKELVISVKCIGYSFEDTLKKLEKMKSRSFKTGDEDTLPETEKVSFGFGTPDSNQQSSEYVDWEEFKKLYPSNSTEKSM